MTSEKFLIFLIFSCSIACAIVQCVDDCYIGYSALRSKKGQNEDALFADRSTFNQSLNNLPLNLTITPVNVTNGNGKVTTIPGLRVSVDYVRENILLTLLAIPFNTSECPSRLNGTEDLRQFSTSYYLNETDANVTVIDFNCIFTGCYYFMMKNNKGEKWQHEPLYYQRNYNYADTAITTIGKPKYDEYSRMLEFYVKLPFHCLRGTMMLCHLIKKDTKTTEDCKPQYFFHVENASVAVALSGGCPRSLCYSSLEAYISERANDSEVTIISMKWKNLTSGLDYYIKINSNLYNCYEKYPNSGIRQWAPPGMTTRAYTVHRDYKPEIPCTTDVAMIAWLTVGIPVTIAILGYWCLRCRKVCRNLTYLAYDELETSAAPDNSQELKQILLIYERGSDQFMEMIKNFRHDLAKECHCDVHEVYSREDFRRVAALTPAGWLREQMNNGSKCVWVDTPELRSRFKDGQQKKASLDFRAAATPYAVALIKNLPIDDPSQYVGHYVVQIKEYEFKDGLANNPLLTVSSNVRYSYPDHFKSLCKQLKSRTGRSEDTNIEVPSSSSISE